MTNSRTIHDGTPRYPPSLVSEGTHLTNLDQAISKCFASFQSKISNYHNRLTKIERKSSARPERIRFARTTIDDMLGLATDFLISIQGKNAQNKLYVRAIDTSGLYSDYLNKITSFLDSIPNLFEQLAEAAIKFASSGAQAKRASAEQTKTAFEKKAVSVLSEYSSFLRFWVKEYTKEQDQNAVAGAIGQTRLPVLNFLNGLAETISVFDYQEDGELFLLENLGFLSAAERVIREIVFYSDTNREQTGENFVVDHSILSKVVKNEQNRLGRKILELLADLRKIEGNPPPNSDSVLIQEARKTSQTTLLRAEIFYENLAKLAEGYSVDSIQATDYELLVSHYTFLLSATKFAQAIYRTTATIVGEMTAYANTGEQSHNEKAKTASNQLRKQGLELMEMHKAIQEKVQKKK